MRLGQKFVEIVESLCFGLRFKKGILDCIVHASEAS